MIRNQQQAEKELEKLKPKHKQLKNCGCISLFQIMMKKNPMTKQLHLWFGDDNDWDRAVIEQHRQYIKKTLHKSRQYMYTYGDMCGWSEKDTHDKPKNSYGEIEVKYESRINGNMRLFKENLEKVWNECPHKKTV